MGEVLVQEFILRVAKFKMEEIKPILTLIYLLIKNRFLQLSEFEHLLKVVYLYKIFYLQPKR